MPVVPLAPIEELHASSVQHPSFPSMRWLLNTRRVPVLSPADLAKYLESTGGAAEHAKPSCAGVGDMENRLGCAITARAICALPDQGCLHKHSLTGIGEVGNIPNTKI